MEFRFANPSAFQWLWFLPIIIVATLFLLRWHQQKIRTAMGDRLGKFLSASLSQPRRQLKLILEILAVVLFIVAYARPQAGQVEQQVKSEGIELVLVVDVSTSMLAEDVRPSRLELVKRELHRFLDRVGGDKIGLVAFAGSAATLSPMTTDKSALKMYIDALSTQAVSTQGTNFQRALDEAYGALARGHGPEDRSPQERVTQAIVILSDGEDHEEAGVEAARKLIDEGVHIFTLGVGTEQGGPIPVRDERGNLRGHRRDRQGNVIMTRTQGTILKTLAREGRGSFYHLTFGGNAMEQLAMDLEKLERAEFDSSTIVDYDERYQLYLFLAIFLALIELLLGERRGLGRLWRGRFEVRES